ncbi:MAG: YhdH/YhfP family quinone oxidoreductase [Chitinophagaceae bacterium]|nr:YhdH/YhfP family quinone oxidoreductase [Chitinophagaceae bacterium]
MSFRSLRITETPAGKFERNIVEREIDDLPSGEVLIKVQYTSLNYKDALSATGNKGITKKFPHTPGIDAAGIVEISRNPNFATGEEVIVTGYDLGMNTDGGMAEYIRVPGQWIVHKPTEYSLKECMIIGTAGFTAASALYKMQLMGQLPSDGPVVVTGSTGGVGSMAVCILSKAGYEVIAVTGKTQVSEYLQHLGASKIESREFVNDKSGKALLKPKWSGAIDTVGGSTLVTLLKACRPEGCVISTGLVDSPKMDATLYPFILNGVNLMGIGSAGTPMERRLSIWDKLAQEWSIKDKLPVIAKEVTLDEVNNTCIDSILQGKMVGRIVVKL